MSDSPDVSHSEYDPFDDPDWAERRRRIPPFVYAIGTVAGLGLVVVIIVALTWQQKQPDQTSQEKQPDQRRSPRQIVYIPVPQPQLEVRQPEPVPPSPDPGPVRPVEKRLDPPAANEPPPDPAVKPDPLPPSPSHSDTEEMDRRIAEDFLRSKYPSAEVTQWYPPVAATDVGTGQGAQLYRATFTRLVVAEIGNRVGKQTQRANAYVLIVDHHAVHWMVGDGGYQDNQYWKISDRSSVVQNKAEKDAAPGSPPGNDAKSVNLSDIANWLAKWQRIRARDLGHSGNPLTEQEKFEQLDRQVRDEWERDFEGHIFRSDAMTVTAMKLDHDGSIWITAHQIPRYIRLHITDVDDDAVHKVRVKDRIAVTGILTCPGRSLDRRSRSEAESFWKRVSGDSSERVVEGIYVDSVRIGLRR